MKPIPAATLAPVRLFPLYASKVVAGFPSPADDYIEARLDLNEYLVRHKDATFFLRVKGDSMKGANIHDGNLLIVDKALEPKHNHKPKDSSIFPFWYAPVVVVEKGRRILRPMRYHCRPNGKPASYDRRFDGLYNARRDSLEKFWKDVFGQHHAFVVAHSFYENVARHRAESRELHAGEEPENVVLHFNPRASGPMALACLWDRWQAPGQPDLESFAAITDEPPPKVSAAGHDRCIVPLKPPNLDAWLMPEQQDRVALYAILDDRERPYYEHRLAA